MVLKLDECWAKGLLKKMPPSHDKANRSLQHAQRWLKEAAQTLKGGASSATVLSAYLAMFHAARAILFQDGVRERSHACVARYLESYVQCGALERKWVDLLDHSRERRHEDQYDLSFISTEEDAAAALETAQQFLRRMKRLLQERVV